MTKDTNNYYYVERKDALLKHFNSLMKSTNKVLLVEYSKDFAETAITNMQQEFEKLIPEIPYIGGDKNRLTQSLIGAIELLAIYNVLKKLGKDVETIGKITYDAIIMKLSSLSIWQKLKLRFSWHMRFKQRAKNFMKKCAEQSQARIYPQDFVYNYVKGNSNDFDFGLDFIECAVCKFFHQKNADEFTPYVCLFDFAMSKFVNSGLVRTTTLAEGAKKCDFRYKEGRTVKMRWPVHR